MRNDSVIYTVIKNTNLIFSNLLKIPFLFKECNFFSAFIKYEIKITLNVFFFLHFTAPGTAPRNVRARPHSTQTIRIDWDEPEIPNGIIQV